MKSLLLVVVVVFVGVTLILQSNVLWVESLGVVLASLASVYIGVSS